MGLRTCVRQEVTVLQLVDSLKAAGVAPAINVPWFLEHHPQLAGEIRQARDAGFSWVQIADQIDRDYGWRPDPKSLPRQVAGP